MCYFDYLGATKKEDNKKTFETYLIDILDYTREEAQREASYYYIVGKKQ
jgi:hypothetical protein